MKRLIALGLTVLWFAAGCASAPEQPVTAPAGGDPAPEDAAASAAAAQETQSPGSKAPDRVLLTGQAARNEVQKILRQAFDALNAGEDEKTRADLEYAQEMEPDNKQVKCLLRGITADPATALGSESTPYTVSRGESLGTIARRFMGDVCEFYILARYNQIKVPKQLGAGQTIRIPGRIAIAAPPPPPPPTTTGVPAPVPKRQPATVEKKAPAAPVAVEPDVRATRAEIDRRHRIAQDAYRRHDLATAIREWDAVLALDPNHNPARVGRQQALDLQVRLENIGKK